jgi:hypothetical protein
MAALTRGPILVTFFGGASGAARARAFSITVGFYAEFTIADVAAMAKQAGLVVKSADDRANWPYAVLEAS